MNKSVKLYKNAIVKNSTIGNNSIIGDDSRIINCKLSENIRIDRRNYCQESTIGRRTYTGCDTRIYNSKIGSFCSISWGVTIGGGEHKLNRISTHDFYYSRYTFRNESCKPDIHDRYEDSLEIGNDVWIGAGAVILRGTNIGNGAVIGANAVVTKDIPPYSIAVGNPAKVVKYRFEKEIIKDLLELEWWYFSDDILSKYFDLLKSEDIQQVINKLKYEVK